MPLGWSVIKELLALRRRLDGLLAAMDGDVDLLGPAAPTSDLYEDQSGVAVIVEVPGVEPESIELQLRDDRLRISGRYARSAPEGDARWLRMERRTGAFLRELVLPPGVHRGEPTSRLDRGVLIVHVGRTASGIDGEGSGGDRKRSLR